MKDNLKFIGENIRIARKNRNLTIESLSELIGISESFLGTIERGESGLSIETLINVCKALNVSSDSIIMTETELISPSGDKKDILLTLLSNSSDEEITFLIDYIKLYRGRVKF